MAQYVFTMNRVGKIVPPKRHILKDISLSFFPGAKIGVLLDLVGGDEQLGKDIAMHIAAAFPKYLDKTTVPPAVIASEREIFAKQVAGKPANIIEKIVDGKMKKFYEQVCLVDQAFIKDQDQTISALVKAKSAELGDGIAIKRFARYQVGEAI